MLKADSFNFLFFFSLLSLSLSFFPFLVRARHIPPFCAVHLQRSAPTLLRARFSVLRAKRAPRGLTAHQTLALTLDRSPFGRVFFDSAGSTPFHALPTPRISRFSQARDRERYIERYIYIYLLPFLYFCYSLFFSFSPFFLFRMNVCVYV